MSMQVQERSARQPSDIVAPEIREYLEASPAKREQMEMTFFTTQLLDQPVGRIRRVFAWLASLVTTPIETSGRYLETKLIACLKAYQAHEGNQEAAFQEACQAFKTRLYHIAPHLQGNWKRERAIFEHLLTRQGMPILSQEEKKAVLSNVQKSFNRPLKEKVQLVGLFAINVAISQLLFNSTMLSGYLPGWAQAPCFVGGMMLSGNIMGTLSANQDWGLLKALFMGQTAWFVKNTFGTSYNIYQETQEGKMSFFQRSFQEFMIMHSFLQGSSSLVLYGMEQIRSIGALSPLHGVAKGVQRVTQVVHGLTGFSQLITMVGCLGRWWTTPASNTPASNTTLQPVTTPASSSPPVLQGLLVMGLACAVFKVLRDKWTIVRRREADRLQPQANTSSSKEGVTPMKNDGKLEGVLYRAVRGLSPKRVLPASHDGANE